MVALLVIVVLGVARLVCSEQPCPALPGQLGRPQDLDISTFSASLDPEQVEEGKAPGSAKSWFEALMS